MCAKQSYPRGLRHTGGKTHCSNPVHHRYTAGTWTKYRSYPQQVHFNHTRNSPYLFTCSLPAQLFSWTPLVFLQFTASISPHVHFKCPCGVPIRDTAITFFGTFRVAPLRFSSPVSPASKQAIHLKLSLCFPSCIPWQFHLG
jgi:hypothetical protein